MRGRGRRNRMGRRGIRGLKARVGRGCCISRGRPDWTMEVYGPEGAEEEVTALETGTHQGEAPGTRSAKSPKFGEGEQ